MQYLTNIVSRKFHGTKLLKQRYVWLFLSPKKIEWTILEGNRWQQDEESFINPECYFYFTAPTNAFPPMNF